MSRKRIGWFRAARPTFEVGEAIEAHVDTGSDGVPRARVGDSVLVVDGAADVERGAIVALRVTAFDPESGEGHAERE